MYDYVLDAGTYTNLDYDYAEQFFKNKYDNWKGGCTAVATVTNDGKTLVGRNMDLSISNNPAYISRTKVDGCYETVGLTYANNLGNTYADVLEKGVPEDYYKVIPFLSTDVLNSEGLYIEINMRDAEYWPTGTSKFGCSGTNPSSNKRICSLSLGRYIAEHCATVEEAVKLAKSLDIYTINVTGFSWNFCFMIADANGKYGLLEIANNKVVWLEGQKAQANFYINEDFAKIQEFKSGVGRYDTVTKGVEAVQSEDDMYELIKKVSYSQIYSLDNKNFDVRSELVGTYDNWTYDYVMDEKNKEEVMNVQKKYSTNFNSLTRQELQDKNAYWESIFTEVANCNSKKLFVRFFEDEARTITLGFDK